jgi:hypothetical protein
MYLISGIVCLVVAIYFHWKLNDQVRLQRIDKELKELDESLTL